MTTAEYLQLGDWTTDRNILTNAAERVVMGPDMKDGDDRRRICVVDAHAGRFTRGGKFVGDEECEMRDGIARLIAAVPNLVGLLLDMRDADAGGYGVRIAAELAAAGVVEAV